jgi:hypothetical protein
MESTYTFIVVLYKQSIYILMQIHAHQSFEVITIILLRNNTKKFITLLNKPITNEQKARRKQE